MADNVTLDPGAAGDTIAADDIGGVKFPRSKIVIGADGTNDGDVSSANPLPVTHGALTELAAAIDTEVQVDVVGPLPAGTNAIGKLAANSGVDIGDVDVTSLPSTVHSADFDTGAGTDATLAFGIAVPASGGAAVVPGDATAGLKVDLGADNDVVATGPAAAGAAASGNPVQVAGKETGGTLQTIRVDGDGDQIVHQRTADTALADNASNTAAVPVNEDQSAVIYAPTVPYMFDGAAWDRVRGDATNGLLVNLGSNNDVTVTGEVELGATALAALETITVASVTAPLAAGDNNIGNVDIVTVPAPLSTTGGGTEATALRVTVASDSTGVLSVDDNGGALTVDNGGTFATQAQLTPVTSGGLSPSKTISAASTNSTNVKASAGQLYELFVSNINAAVRYLKLYDKATAPTVGTDTPIWTLAIPGNTAGAGFAKTIPNGLAFANGIGFGLTTGVADNDTGAVAANEIVVNLGYK